MTQIAIGVIDVQRGFIPASEGERLGVGGFGELGIATGEAVVPVINGLLAAAAERGWAIFTTQDWHPAQTAHFSDTPDFVTTWPVHCVAGSAGAELHPELVLPAGTVQFHKGSEVLTDGADDTSYSGWHASNVAETLPEYVRRNAIETIYLVGLAFDYCVGRTALDLAQRGGVRVIVLTDATRAVADASAEQMKLQLQAAGVALCTAASIGV